jgi:hypothetical protein
MKKTVFSKKGKCDRVCFFFNSINPSKTQDREYENAAA